jgi:outer membrane protein TolC
VRRGGLAPLALIVALLGGCVSRSAGRAEADALLEQRIAVARRPLDDAQTRAARQALLSKPLDADRAARLAVLAHPDVDAAYAELGVARAELVRALRLPNPELEAAVTFHDGAHDYELGASIDVIGFLRLASAGAAADKALDAAAIEAAGMAIDAAFQAKLAFYRYVAARQALEMRRTAAFALAQGAEAARAIHQAGNSPALESLGQQALFEESRVMVTRAEVEERGAREALSLAMGVFGTEAASWRVPDRLLDPPAREPGAADAERRALAQSLELRALRARYAAAAARSDLAAWGWVPELSAGAVAEREEGHWEVGPQVAVEVPLFYQGQGEADAAGAQMAAARARIRGTAAMVRAAARNMTVRVQAAREQALFYRDTLLPLRQRVVDETLRHYNAMNTSVFALLSAKRDHIEAGRAYVEALRDYWTARAELEQLLAGRLPRGAGSAAAEGDSAAGSAAPAAEH